MWSILYAVLYANFLDLLLPFLHGAVAVNTVRNITAEAVDGHSSAVLLLSPTAFLFSSAALLISKKKPGHQCPDLSNLVSSCHSTCMLSTGACNQI